MATRDDPTQVPDQIRPGAPFAGATLGELVGRGGLASVYRLLDAAGGAHPARCIKIGYRPDSTESQADRQARLNAKTQDPSAPPPKEGYAAGVVVYGTGWGGFHSVPAAAISDLVAAEYRVLRKRPTALLPTVEAAGTDRGLSYYVMEYFAGPTLRAALAGRGAADRFGLLQGFAQFVATLDSAHQSGTAFIHGDLKPENIIVTPERWRLIDPAPRNENGIGELGLPYNAGFISTLATRAYNPTLTFSMQSDLRALAIILFEIVAGWQPFMRLPSTVRYVVVPDELERYHREVWACLETEACQRLAEEQFVGQLLGWLREPPWYTALEAFARAASSELGGVRGMRAHDKAATDATESPTLIADYAIGAAIGAGGLATVYRLYDPRTGQLIDRCVKIGHDLPPHGHDPSPQRLQPRGEGDFPARCLGASSEFVHLELPTTAQIRDVLVAEYAYLRDQPHDLFPRVEMTGEVWGRPYYVMEYLAGPTLRHAFASAAPPDSAALLPGFTRLVAELHALRTADPAFVHGDLKPENIIITGDRWRLIDPARGAGTNEFPGLCTWAYNPWPDPWGNGEENDTRALVIVLFEILTGWQPFATLSAHGEGGANKWVYGHAGSTNPEPWSCLETERCARYAAEPLLRQLLAWMAEPPTAAVFSAVLAREVLGGARRSRFFGEPAKAVAFARGGTPTLPPPGRPIVAPLPPPRRDDATVEAVGPGFAPRLDALHLNQWVANHTRNLLQDISLSISPGEFVALVGIAGVGRTTLLEALSGVRPAQGTVLLNGDDLYAHADFWRRAIGHVRYEELPRRARSVYDTLDDAARRRLPPGTTREERHTEIGAVLKELGLTEQQGVRVTQLDAGTRKRVQIGMELLTGPRLLFLDEPTAGLDPAGETHMMHVLRRIANRGVTVTLVTHATQTLAVCDLVIVLARGGYLAYFGPPDEARQFFGVTAFEDIYALLFAPEAPDEWAQRYRLSPQYRTYVQERLAR